MSKYPDRIWAYAGAFKMWRDKFPEHAKSTSPTEYIRADVSAALVAAAREEALREAADVAKGCGLVIAPENVSQRVGAKSVQSQVAGQILALITKDADNG